MDQAALTAIRLRLDAITRSIPWQAMLDERTDTGVLFGPPRRWWDGGGGMMPARFSLADAEFIAHAPDDIAALLAEIERLSGTQPESTKEKAQ